MSSVSRVLLMIFGCWLWLRPAPVTAQELPVLDPGIARLIAQEISGDASYEHIRYLTQFHRPRAGADGLWRAAEYFEAKARAIGLDDVRLIKQASSTRPWNAQFADLWITEPAERIASTLQSKLHLADYSRSTDVTAELVDIGGATATDFERVDVRGKIVLSYAPLFVAMQRAVFEHGALGVVWYPDPGYTGNGIDGSGFSRPDQLRWNSLPSGSVGGAEPTFGFVLSLRQGAELSARLGTSSEPVMVRAVVDAAFTSEQGDQPWQVMVEAVIRGSDPTIEQDVVLTGHLQEEGTSANDDASGTANVLEIARALHRLIGEERIPRPRRTLRFWWLTEISSQRQYFADNPERYGSLWVNVNQDMVGANQAQDVMRKQAITRLPATRFHFFNDVAEAVIEYMVASNTFELAQLQNGVPLYPNEHVSHLGTRHRYNAGMILFHNNTDHMPFNEAPIGIPGITFTNMPDRFIHSSDDDLWNVDRTQLGRNAVAAALIAYTMASADSVTFPTLAAETVGRGMERLARNARLGMTWLATWEDKDAALHAARDQIAFAAARERRAIASLTEAHGSASNRTESMLSELERRAAQAVRDTELSYRQETGTELIPTRSLTTAEEELRRTTPVLVGGPGDFLSGRGQIPSVPGLHSLMAFEVLNAVNGERTGLDIYRLVAAEAREGGEHYYGTVTAESVLQYLRGAASTGLIRIGA